MSIKSLVKKVLIQQQNKRYERLLKTRTVTYDTWIREEEQKAFEGKYEVSALPEKADFILFLQDGVTVAEHAVDWITEIFECYPQVAIIYGDEDVRGEDGLRSTPWFKPDWSPEVFREHFYFGGAVAVRRSFADRKMGENCTQEDICNYVIQAGGFRKGCKSIYHLPRILCHNNTKEKMEEWLSKPNRGFAKRDLKQAENMLSIIIPSKDHPELLKNCFSGIKRASKDVNFEILVIDNGSAEENKIKIQALMAEFERTMDEKPCSIRYIYEPMEFNFSHMCNLGAAQARGNIYLFLNDDVELCEEYTLKKMEELAVQEYAGAVGLKLLYPETRRIQHAGITNLPMGPVHKLQFLDDDEEYYFKCNRGVRNVIGVTAACLMLEADKFAEIGGFSVELQVAFNDVDLCFNLYEHGYHNVCRNDMFAYHHESLSRGADETTEKWLRLMKEREKLYMRHPELEGKDPYFGIGLAREGLDSRIRGKYEIVGNTVQQGNVKEWKLQEEACRKDDCLMLRVEECRENSISGYAVVLGDNNACYDYELLLKNKDTSQIYAIKLERQYRPDLVENMPDQVQVGLCGFALVVNNEVLPKGEYAVGIVAVNRINKGRLLNFSSRILNIEKR